MSETIDPPIALPPARRSGKLGTIAVFAAIIALAAAVGFAIQYGAGASDSATITGENPAYPLIGHWEATASGNRYVACDPSSVRAWTDGRNTVTVVVDLGVPGVVDVWIPTSELNGRMPMHLTQQTTVRGTSARFTTWVANTDAPVQVSGFNKHDIGSCSVMPQVQ